jgi:ribosome-associated protein
MGRKIQVIRDIYLDEEDIHFDFIRASGPGGQKINKASTAVQLRYRLGNSSLPGYVKRNLAEIAGKQLNRNQEVVIDARRFRSQIRNREDALRRLTKMVARSARKPTPRLKTRPSLSARRRRLQNKRKKGERKKYRRNLDRKVPE